MAIAQTTYPVMPDYSSLAGRGSLMTAGGGGGGILPGSASGGGGAYGGRPNVPSPGGSASAAISGDLANLSSLYSLGDSINSNNQSQLIQQYQNAIPNYSALQSQASDVTGQQLHGELPDDVITQLLQQAAERGIMTGSPGSPNSNAAYLRALGLTSLNMQDTGFKNLHQLTSDAPIAPLFDISKMLITPEDQQQAQMAANIYAAAPDPTKAAQAAQAAATPPEPAPWWQSPGFAASLGPGTWQSGPMTWHTPYAG